MPHSFNKIWIHAIWSIKNRAPLLTVKVEEKIYQIMRDQFAEMGCTVLIINGAADHVHFLFVLNPQKSVAEVIKHVKGVSSHHINYHNLIPQKFAWQTGYAAYSVSQSVVENVFQYIHQQKEHHRKKSFGEEYNAFLRVHGFETTGQNENR